LRNKKPKLITEFKCDHCGDTTSSFVTTSKYKHFCRIQTPGYPADKDCMSGYLNKESIAQPFAFQFGTKKL